VGKIAKKIHCHVVKDTLLQTAFSAILPTGRIQYYKYVMVIRFSFF